MRFLTFWCGGSKSICKCVERFFNSTVFFSFGDLGFVRLGFESCDLFVSEGAKTLGVFVLFRCLGGF